MSTQGTESNTVQYLIESVGTESTPRLVREFASLKAAHLGERFDRERHSYLSAVVTELRERGVLD